MAIFKFTVDEVTVCEASVEAETPQEAAEHLEAFLTFGKANTTVSYHVIDNDVFVFNPTQPFH